LPALHISAALVGDAIKQYCSGHLRNSIRDTKQLVEIFLADLLRKASNGQHVFSGHSGVIFFAVWSDMLRNAPFLIGNLFVLQNLVDISSNLPGQVSLQCTAKVKQSKAEPICNRCTHQAGIPTEMIASAGSVMLAKFSPLGGRK
jgi:hypothetical protein